METEAMVSQVVGRVDTHQDLHMAAAVSLEGEVLGSKVFSTTRVGYRAMLAWFRSQGELLRVGVEATGSSGAGLTHHTQDGRPGPAGHPTAAPQHRGGLLPRRFETLYVT